MRKFLEATILIATGVFLVGFYWTATLLIIALILEIIYG